MVLTDQECMAAAVCIIIILGAIRRRRNSRRPVRRSCWVRPWIRRCPQFGAFHALLKELSTEDPPSFRNFLRMDQTTFEELLTLVSPLCLYYTRSCMMHLPLTLFSRLLIGSYYQNPIRDIH